MACCTHLVAFPFAAKQRDRSALLPCFLAHFLLFDLSTSLVEWTAVHHRGTSALIVACGLVCTFAACFQLLARSLFLCGKVWCVQLPTVLSLRAPPTATLRHAWRGDVALEVALRPCVKGAL